MQHRTLTILSVAFAGGISACAAPRMDTAWPEPRPLGAEITPFRPPRQPTAPAPEPAAPPLETTQVESPTGAITLREALALALMQNPDLAVFSWEVRAREARTLQAGLLPNPELGVEAENFGGTGGLQGVNATETTIQLGQLIELAGKRPKRKHLAALERDLAGWDYESRRIDVLAETTKVFVDVLAAQERLSLNEELVRLAEQVLESVSERVKTGKVSPIEEIKAGVALSANRIERERARRQLEAARKELAAAWGSSSPGFERVEGELYSVVSIPTAEQLAGRISKNPEIARWVVEMEQRRASVQLEKAGRIPDPTLSGGIRRLNETGDTAFVMGLSIPLPVFDRNQGALLEARYRLAKAEEERRVATTRVRTSLARAYQALSSSHAEASALKNDVLPGAQRAFEAVSEGFRQGKFGYLEVLDAQRTFFEARAQYIEALAGFHKAVSDVERLVGERLTGIEDTMQPEHRGELE